MTLKRDQPSTAAPPVRGATIRRSATSGRVAGAAARHRISVPARRPPVLPSFRHGLLCFRTAVKFARLCRPEGSGVRPPRRVRRYGCGGTLDLALRERHLDTLSSSSRQGANRTQLSSGTSRTQPLHLLVAGHVTEAMPSDACRRFIVEWSDRVWLIPAVPWSAIDMTSAGRKTISLPPDLARAAE